MHVCVATSNYSDIRPEKRTSAYVPVYCKESRLILKRNKKLTRTRWLGLYCVVHLVIVCLFVCHPGRHACRHPYIFTIHRHTQSKFREANARLYNNNNVGEWGWGVEGKQVGSMDEVTSQRLL